MTAAQNILLKKLNITKDGPPVATDIEEYINKFRQGLTEEHVQLILELFAPHLPELSSALIKDAS